MEGHFQTSMEVWVDNKNSGGAVTAVLLDCYASPALNNGDPILCSTTAHNQIWICDICHKQIHGRKHISLWFNGIASKIHRYPHSTIYRYLDLYLYKGFRLTTHTQHHSFEPSPKPLPTPHLHHHRNPNTYTRLTPLVPKGLVKTKHQTLIHSPLIPPRAKHISHTHFIPRTTLISCTVAALDIIPDPRVPATYS